MVTNINDVLKYIELHLQEDLSLELLANEFHYSQSYLSRQFNKYVGMNLNEYISRRRLSLIATELRKENKTISYLSDIYGFKSQKYFSTRFKELFSITPSTYKKGKTFIVLQQKRIVKGEQQFMINNMKEMCFYIWSHSSDENTLLDTINSIENTMLYKKENSKITLITYFEEKEYTQMYEVELNLINGIYTHKSIFHIINKQHRILDLNKEDNQYYVLFEDINTNKQLRAYLEYSKQPYVIFQTDTVNGFKIAEDDGEHLDIKKGYQDIDQIKEKLLTLTNIEEIKQFCEQDNTLFLMRHFGSEFVFVKLLQQGRWFVMMSIYVNMSTKEAISYYFFGTKADSTNVRLEKDGILLKTFVDDELYAVSHILGGDEIVSDITLKFPSGMSGSGGWDFSPEFK